MQNLLQNALRHTPEDGAVELYATYNGKELIVTIQDEGMGLDKSFDPFSPFKKGVDSPRVGLGLFLVRQAVESMGGKIALQNRTEEKGAIATLKLHLLRNF